MTFDDRMRLARAAEAAGDPDGAYHHYVHALEVDAARHEAWLGKARTAGLRTGWRVLPVDEITAAVAQAVERAPLGQRDALRCAGAALVRDLAVAHHERSRRHLQDYVSARGEWREHLGRCADAVRALEEAHRLDPANPVSLETTVAICVLQLEGVVYDDIGDYQIVTQRRHGITGGYEKELKAKIADCAAQLQVLRPGWVPPEVHVRELDPKSTCFVVTTTVGRDHPDAVTLRRWRDEELGRSACGRALVRAYAQVGPLAAALVRRSRPLRRLSRALLIRPLATLLRRRR